MTYNPYNRYAQQSVMTMTHGEMLAKLYEGLIKNMNLAVKGIEENDITAANISLKKAQKIINYLLATLDRKYEVSNNLAALYDFFNYQLIMANVKKSTTPILEVVPMVEELRATFIECDRLARTNGSVANSVAPQRLAVSG